MTADAAPLIEHPERGSGQRCLRSRSRRTNGCEAPYPADTIVNTGGTALVRSRVERRPVHTQSCELTEGGRVTDVYARHTILRPATRPEGVH